MDAGQAQRSAGSSPNTFEEGPQESYLGGSTRAVADWVEALTGYQTSASSRERILRDWAGEEGLGEAEDRQRGFHELGLQTTSARVRWICHPCP